MTRHYERVICPKCSGPFFRDSPARELCGVCVSHGIRELTDPANRPPRALAQWPEWAKFEDAAVPSEPRMNAWVGKSAPDRSFFGDSALARSDFRFGSGERVSRKGRS